MRTALVTGAGRGIGAATARALGRRGFHVVVNYRSDGASADRVVRDIEKSGGSAAAIRADVTDASEAAELVAASGRLAVLVCNANIQPVFVPLSHLHWEVLSAGVTAELAAAFHVTKAALPILVRGSHVVYVSSVAADTFSTGGAVLSTKKAALDAFAQQVATEAGHAGIAVNIVAPGAVRTDASAAMLTPRWSPNGKAAQCWAGSWSPLMSARSSPRWPRVNFPGWRASESRSTAVTG